VGSDAVITVAPDAVVTSYELSRLAPGAPPAASETIIVPEGVKAKRAVALT
jgi:hypothetical protein